MTTPDPLGGIALPYSVILQPRGANAYDLFVEESMQFEEGTGEMQVSNRFWGVPIPRGSSIVQVVWEGQTDMVIRLYRGNSWWNVTTLAGKGDMGVPENTGTLSFASPQHGDHLRFIFTGGFPTYDEVNMPYLATVNVFPVSPFTA